MPVSTTRDEILAKLRALKPRLKERASHRVRNRIAHGCRGIGRAAIWAIVQAPLPPLRAAVRRMLAAPGEPPA